MSIRHPKLAPRRSPNTPHRHDLGGRTEPDAAFRALRLLVLSHLVDGPLTAAQLRHVLDARRPLDLDAVLADLAERGEVEIERYRVTPAGPLETHYVVPRN